MDKTQEIPSINPLKKRARSKYITNALAYRLASVTTDKDFTIKDTKKRPYVKIYNRAEYLKQWGVVPMYQQYYNSSHCCDELTQKGKVITAKYCNYRWCLTCNRIRTAKFINGYKLPLESLKDKQFLTISRRNIFAKDLEKEIIELFVMYKQIKDSLRKFHIPHTGIRKFEITCKEVKTGYHPHFHSIIEGKENCELFLEQWMKRNGKKSDIQAQKIVPCDINTPQELFKYFTKIFTNKTANVRVLDNIFRAMRGRRVFQPMGIKKDVSEDVDEIISEEFEFLEDMDATILWNGSDWYNTLTGEALTGYTPSKNVEQLITNISDEK